MLITDRPEAQLRSDIEAVAAEAIWQAAFSRDRAELRRAHRAAAAVVTALRREGVLVGLPARGSYVHPDGEPKTRGISHLVAEAIVLMDLPEIHRDVLRALMPPGHPDTIKTAFNKALRVFHQRKWIERRLDGIVVVLDLGALSDWFTEAVDLNEGRAATTLDLANAIQELRKHDPDDEIRRQELQALQRLMESAPGAVTGERGQVRIIGKSRLL